MNAIKRRFIGCLTGAVLCACAAVFGVCNSMWHAAILFAAAAIILTVLAARASEGYHSAKLIAENPILNVGVASVRETGSGAEQGAVSVVVSGFGILMDGRPYKFGHGGVELTAAAIDRESITLSFGGGEGAYSVRLLHGVAERAEIERLSERLRYETGVDAKVSGW